MRYTGDTNKVGFFFESGTYGNVGSFDATSGTVQSFGLVSESAIDEAYEKVPIRHVGGGRSVTQFVNTTEDFTGTITYHPQDFKMLGFALGSIVTTGSATDPVPYLHTLKMQDNGSPNIFTSGTDAPFISFTHSDVQGRDNDLAFRRVVNGCIVDSFTLSASEGEPLECEVAYVGQNLTPGSLVGSSMTVSTTRPYLWSDSNIQIGASGTAQIVNEVKDWTYTVNNNLLSEHYANGSKIITTPLPQNRDIEFTATMDSNSKRTGSFYDQYFKGGSVFNMLVTVKATDAGTGSRQAFIYLSGCKMMDMDDPSPVEGVDEVSMTINASGTNAAVTDTVSLYEPWSLE